MSKFKDFFSQAKFFLGRSDIKFYTRSLVTIFGELHKLNESPDILTGLACFTKIGSTVIENFDDYSTEYFQEQNWERIYSQDFSKLVLKTISNCPKTVIAEIVEGAANIVTVKIDDDINVGYVEFVNQNSSFIRYPDIFVEGKNYQAAKDKIRKMLWENLGSSNIVLKKNQSVAWETSGLIFDIDEIREQKDSPRIDEYIAKYARCRQKGINRSVLFYGPPGTGKSTLAQSIIQKMQLKSFRMRVEDMSHINNAMIAEAIEIFQPTAILLDDFDRISSQDSILETLEFFQNKVNLIIATANDKDSLNEAVLRPGRFDELISITEMDEVVIRQTLQPPVSESDFEIIKKWPIAFIIEYQKRRQICTDDEIAASLIELNDRATGRNAFSGRKEVQNKKKEISTVEIGEKMLTEDVV